MAIVESYPLTIEENADRSGAGAIVFTYYTNYEAGTTFDFTGYTASAMFRQNVSDAAPTLTLTPTLGGAAGTITLSWTAANANTLVAAWSNLAGRWSLMLTSGGGTESYFIGDSPVALARRSTR